ncbi:MAG TPA: TonB C-terminal domain-containing protein [Blastocatellia bacterium]|nr:TonB C-terminal domain-containing protein [Blastocatellia bacterium]
MLRTIDSYIESPTDGALPASLGSGFIRDHRFLRLLAVSIAGHLLLCAVVVNLDIWVSRHRWTRTGHRGELVKLIDLTAPADRSPELRRPPDPIERADLSRFQYDPEHGDDVNLVARSPKPTVARGSGLKLPAVKEVEEHSKNSSRGGGEGNRTSEGRQAPPVTQSVTGSTVSKPEAQPVAQALIPQASAPPPVPAPKASNSGQGVGTQPGAQGSARGDGTETTLLGMENVQAQFRAYVRAKIRQVNEKIMPRTWIAEVLSKKVSADFEVRLDRGGRLVSARRVRSTGYPRLDDVANDAIYMASPFEGFPPDAGDVIILTVTVSYTPWR